MGSKFRRNSGVYAPGQISWRMKSINPGNKKEGDACKTQELSVLPRQECGEGLICSQTLAKCVPVESKCTKERRRARAGDVIKCDEFGFYEPVVCKSGVLCYCVNKNGKRIFGTDVASKKELMNCKCSRDYDKFPRKVPDGNFLRCLPNGNYDPIQCSDESCYCMGDEFHTFGIVAKSIKELLCYDKRSHRDDDEMLRSKCWHEQNFLERQIQNYTENGVRVIGAYLPKCDLDGSYAPVQCKKNECYCVKKNGELYHKRKYRVKRTPDNVKNMTCRCIRDHEMLMELRTDEKVKAYLDKKPCDNGEYKNIGVIEIKS
ncbi:equistatin isoform X2 [Parasteatoda tepidariorum]|uniref:equistatin isoform X2 n=1 Tax=Parasteatoda tepidariorum TaxID=114398 RepID=UPI0039BCE39A